MGRLFAVALPLVMFANTATADEPAPPPAPYSLPWMLRSVVPANVVRIDETLAFYENPTTHASGQTDVTSFAASHKVGSEWCVFFRETWATNSPPAGAPSGNAFSNPLLAATYSHSFAEGWRWVGFAAAALPLGSGGGDTPNPGTAAAIASIAPARSIMENPMFAVNYFGVVGGLDAAWVMSGWTVQGEMAVSQLTRVRGPETQDGSRTNFTSGAHVGYFFTPTLSLGGELRIQRWLSDAAPVKKDPSAREQLTWAVGPRLHFKVGPHSWIRPGVSYARAIDDPMARQSYSIVQLDAPISY